MSKITHKHARERLEDVLDYNDRFDKEDNDALLSDYIKQQEKQEKLLELYRKFYRILTKDSLTVVDMKKAMQLEQQIKELENDK